MAFVLVSKEGSVGRITLNRPQALNALTLEMVREIAAALKDWLSEPAVRIVIIDSANEKAFCAGGDIRALSASGKARDGHAQTFWREEYQLNALIARFSKPIVAIMDGITMGGGVGIGAHASHRVVTDATVMAMPEVGIGFVPDVGGTWLLSRAPGAVGMFAALTGRRLTAADAIVCGLADSYIPRRILPSLLEALRGLDHSEDAAASTSMLLARFSRVVHPGYLDANREWIDGSFGADSIEYIFTDLRNSVLKEAQQALADLSRHSPTSLMLTFRALREAAADDALEDSLRREFRIACRSLENPDFHEGIRAAVVDKDYSPEWKPAALSEVEEVNLDRFFLTLGDEELRFDGSKRSAK